MTSPDTEINLDGKAGDNYKVEPEEKNGGTGARVGSAFQVSRDTTDQPSQLLTFYMFREAAFWRIPPSMGQQ